MEFIFEYSPTVDLLSHLVPRQSLSSPICLSKAVRLWVMLRSIYGHESDPVYCDLGHSFTSLEWRNAFFTDVADFHQQFDGNSLEHLNPNCPCNQTIHYWLFEGYLREEEQKWYQDFINACCLNDDASVASFLQSLTWNSKAPANPKKNRIFACVGRTLKNNLKDLVKLGYLDHDGKNYYQKEDIAKLYQPPEIRNSDKKNIVIPIIHEDLSEVPGIFQETEGETQRFFMHVDYAVARKDLDSDLLYQFKEIWQKNPFPVVKLKYDSASLHRLTERIIHPVCIYYYQRALYLCGYGQTPKHRNKIDWYNYRLDRIRHCETLDWSDDAIPTLLKDQEKKPFTPHYIDQQLRQALGFDFYKPQKTMILRFNQEFSEKYIDESFRHETFTKFSHPKALASWQKKQALSATENQQLNKYLEQWQSTDSNNPTHSYYRMDYRVDDNNVIMRLRAWGPNVEVLFPLRLRQRMADDSKTMTTLYQS
ncbi:TIGR03985 family CRISPR-associated protein (plasmid) [Synechocystis sp. PCC 7339]|uniref:TIGR03985 family CRISPR-associated protein n=1 Tax=Synechocystis sp. PCC 7339 TaxID=2782213 RepID=UPI001CBEC2D3|nr:TIGR03985 family CRISPR-associated protein [Synechocystis sp. PCC 7339]UAJ74631.1 TIGR03985 family CRISPR-associated protein [Synechocystis sp. PCC 7339]